MRLYVPIHAAVLHLLCQVATLQTCAGGMHWPDFVFTARPDPLLLHNTAIPFALQTWAGGVHWPDFVFNPEADSYWRDLLRSWPNGSQWSGLWLGMNEGEQSWGGACQGRRRNVQKNG